MSLATEMLKTYTYMTKRGAGPWSGTSNSNATASENSNPNIPRPVSPNAPKRYNASTGKYQYGLQPGQSLRADGTIATLNSKGQVVKGPGVSDSNTGFFSRPKPIGRVPMAIPPHPDDPQYNEKLQALNEASRPLTNLEMAKETGLGFLGMSNYPEMNLMGLAGTGLLTTATLGATAPALAARASMPAMTSTVGRYAAPVWRYAAPAAVPFAGGFATRSAERMLAPQQAQAAPIYDYINPVDNTYADTGAITFGPTWTLLNWNRDRDAAAKASRESTAELRELLKDDPTNAALRRQLTNSTSTMRRGLSRVGRHVGRGAQGMIFGGAGGMAADWLFDFIERRAPLTPIGSGANSNSGAAGNSGTNNNTAPQSEEEEMQFDTSATN